MKRLYLLDLLALAATLAFAGCGKDDQTSDPAPSEPGLVIEQTDYTLDAVEGRTATVSFTASADWTLTVKYNEDETDSNWLTAEPANGSASRQSNCPPAYIPEWRPARLMWKSPAKSRACS